MATSHEKYHGNHHMLLVLSSKAACIVHAISGEGDDTHTQYVSRTVSNESLDVDMACVYTFRMMLAKLEHVGRCSRPGIKIKMLGYKTAESINSKGLY